MTVLDRNMRIGENASRNDSRKKARLEKVIVRLVNCRTASDRAALRQGFPDLMPKDRDDIDDILMRAWAGLRIAWNHGGFLRRVVLLNMAGRYFLADPLLLVTTPLGEAKPKNWEDYPRYIQEREGNLRKLEESFLEDGFFRVLCQAIDSGGQMRVCQNPRCPHPYYLRSEGGKQFCSKQCAAPSQRAAKLKWWDAHKRNILAARRAEYHKQRKRASRCETKRKEGRQ
jgi:hypothetical protein